MYYPQNLSFRSSKPDLHHFGEPFRRLMAPELNHTKQQKDIEALIADFQSVVDMMEEFEIIEDAPLGDVILVAQALEHAANQAHLHAQDHSSYELMKNAYSLQNEYIHVLQFIAEQQNSIHASELKEKDAPERIQVIFACQVYNLAMQSS